MNQEGIYTTLSERTELPLSNYKFPESEGAFEGVLDFRIWAKRTPALHCYFTTTEGEHICLPLYFENNYTPKKEGPSFKIVEDGTMWYCEYKTLKNGRTRWTLARPIDNCENFSQ